MRKETDILMEKNSLNKIYSFFEKSDKKDLQDLPCLKLIGTFKDEENLFFLTEMLKGKKEVWE